MFEKLKYRIVRQDSDGHTVLKPSEACMEAIKESECLHAVRVVSKKEFYVGQRKENWFNGKPMSQIIDESALLPAEESYAPLSRYIINSCEKMKCNQEVDRFRVSLPSIDGISGAVKN